jgi:hypothetical protein
MPESHVYNDDVKLQCIQDCLIVYHSRFTHLNLPLDFRWRLSRGRGRINNVPIRSQLEHIFDLVQQVVLLVISHGSACSNCSHTSL